MPYLTSISTVSSISNSVGVTSAGVTNLIASNSGGQRSAASVVVSGCSAAESSSKEEEGDLSRATSINSLNTMPSSHRMASDDLVRRTTSPSNLGRMKKSDSGNGLIIKKDDRKV